MIRFTKYGTIRGGVCDQIHAERRQRERGAAWYLALLWRRGCIETVHGWCRVVRLPRCDWRKIAKAGKGFGSGWEIGAFRMQQDVVATLYENRRAFRAATLDKWADEVSAPEWLFGAIGELHGAHYDSIYQQRKAEL